jgi:outer membrane protein assembly factor BamA
LLSDQIDAIEQAYKEKGYSQVKITTEVAGSAAADPGRVHVTFVVEEGRKVKISAVRLTGPRGSIATWS